MNRSVITLDGLNILNNSLAEGDPSQYWIGYYGLAYIPEESRGELAKNIDSLVPAGSGDEIYNIFQGSMADVVAGFDEGDVDAGNLYKQCLYAENIESTFRYALGKDENGNTINTLVTYAQDASDPSKYSHFLTYCGVGGTPDLENTDANKVETGGLPIPAPLFYETDDSDDVVSPDMRNYVSKTGTPGWNASNDDSRAGVSYANDGDKRSISTFNRFHAPSSSEGYAVAHEPACRNMTKATKYFPINHYDVATIIRDGGLIQNLEAGNSSTSLANSKVGTVKYKICINIADYMKKSAQRVNMSGNGTVAPPIGFKFNRIGLYAVPVTLHAFNVVSEDNEKCGGNKVQIEINGDADPVLFAVIDTDTIEMREDGLAKFEIDFSVVFQEDTALVNNPVIFYNLYENDAITWYKNQLLANASTSEAVTTLGVEMSYLRNMVEGLGSSPAACGIGDDGGQFNYVRPGLRNIVDSLNTNHGAVRGIYTLPERENYTVYLTGGKVVPDNASQSLLDELDKVSVVGYTVGENSVVLGKDSLCAGKYGLNLTNYGVIGEDSRSVLLMGGDGKDENHKYNDRHLAVKHAVNSIINIPNGEVSYMTGSIWVGAEPGVWAMGNVAASVGVGRNDLLHYEETGELLQPVLDSVTHLTTHGSLAYSLLLGRNAVYTTTTQSIVIGATDGGSTQKLGVYDVFSDMDAYGMDWTNAEGAESYDLSVFPSSMGGVQSVLSIGTHNAVGRNVYNMLSAGHYDRLPTNSKNSIMIGDHQNQATGFFDRPKMVLTLDEFNERYGSGVAYPIDDEIYTCEEGDLVIIGTGTMRYQDGKNSTIVKTHDVKGVTLYVTYNRTQGSSYVWNTGITVGNGEPGTFGVDPYLHAGLYNTSGHLKNMLMLGDYMDAGNGSSDSILLGDYSGTRKLVFKNSFMNFMGDQTAYNRNATSSPLMTMDNVWWIGSARTRHYVSDVVDPLCPNDYHGDASIETGTYDADTHTINWSESASTTGHLVSAGLHLKVAIEHDHHPFVYKDAFVFRGDNPSVYGHGHWYGASEKWRGLADMTNSEGFTFEYNTLMQPVQAPMMYTGGLALGGYGTNDCNFMLLKVGTSTMLTSDSPSSVGVNQEPNVALEEFNTTTGMLSDYSEIMRGNNSYGPWTQSHLYTDHQVSGVVVAGSTTVTLVVPGDETIDETYAPTVSATNSMTAVINSWDHATKTFVCALTATTNVDVTVTLSYRSHKPGGKKLYNVHNESIFEEKKYVIDHFMVDSPYAGMVLMVQDKQELDGTLHVGLGKPVGRNVVSLMDSDNQHLKSLGDEAITEWDSYAGVDPIAEIQEMLAQNVAPVLKFTISDGDSGTYGDCFAQLCDVRACGYMFTTHIPTLGHRYICVRYSSGSSMTAGHLYVTVSNHDIDISHGDIIP